MKDASIIEKNRAQQALLYLLLRGGKEILAKEIAPNVKIHKDYCYSVINQFHEMGLVKKKRPGKELFLSLTKKGREWAEALHGWYVISKNPTLPKVRG